MGDTMPSPPMIEHLSISEILVVRLLRSAMIDAEVVPAGRFKPRVTKDFLDVSDRTAIE